MWVHHWWKSPIYTQSYPTEHSKYIYTSGEYIRNEVWKPCYSRQDNGTLNNSRRYREWRILNSGSCLPSSISWNTSTTASLYQNSQKPLVERLRLNGISQLSPTPLTQVLREASVSTPSCCFHWKLHEGTLNWDNGQRLGPFNWNEFAFLASITTSRCIRRRGNVGLCQSLRIGADLGTIVAR